MPKLIEELADIFNQEEESRARQQRIDETARMVMASFNWINSKPGWPENAKIAYDAAEALEAERAKRITKNNQEPE